MNSATAKMIAATYDQFYTMGDEMPSADDCRDYWLSMLEDCPDAYEEDWYALVGVPAIEKTIDWEAVSEEVCHMLESEDEE